MRGGPAPGEATRLSHSTLEGWRTGGQPGVFVSEQIIGQEIFCLKQIVLGGLYNWLDNVKLLTFAEIFRFDLQDVQCAVVGTGQWAPWRNVL